MCGFMYVCAILTPCCERKQQIQASPPGLLSSPQGKGVNGLQKEEVGRQRRRITEGYVKNTLKKRTKQCSFNQSKLIRTPDRCASLLVTDESARRSIKRIQHDMKEEGGCFSVSGVFFSLAHKRQ